MNIIDLFNEPKIIGIIGDRHEAKSNTIYYIIDELNKIGKYNLYVYGLRNKIGNSTEINSIYELEGIHNSIIIIDEVMSFWDLDNRMARIQIERTLRMINHNNNILIISALPENVKKFISSKLNIIIYKKVTFSDFINGSSVKKNVLDYKGSERGTSILNLEKKEALIFDGKHYYKENIAYMEKFDSKKDNPEIVNKSVKKNVNNNVEKERLS